MCVVSMVIDKYTDDWKRRGWWDQMPGPTYPYPDTNPLPPTAPATPYAPIKIGEPPISRKEFEKLQKDLEEIKDWIKRAKKYDEANNEPDCEMESKVELLKQVAELVGVEIDIKNL